MGSPSFAARLRRVSGLIRTAAQRYGTSRLALLRRLAAIYWQRGIRPVEAIEAGLGAPSITKEVLAGCFAKDKLMALQDRLNPRELLCLTEDKAIFSPLCSGLGVPVPALFAVVGRDGGWASPGAPLAGQAECERYLADDAPSDFVVKPAAGVYGEGVSALRRVDGGFVDHAGRARTAAELCDRLFKDPQYDRFVVQERLTNHSDIERLTGCAYLQTVRVVTLVDRQGEVRFLNHWWKLIGGDSPSDNYCYGRSGNFVANISFETGALGPAMRPSPDGVGSQAVDVHPRTGAALVGYRLPEWDALLRLARRCALLFQPLRTVGWDIGITPRGPVVVEGNCWWDPVTFIVVGPQAPGVGLHPMVASSSLLWQ